MDEKRCSRCGETKSSGEFHVDNSRPDGLHCWCKACNSAANKERRQDPEYRAKCLARSKAWREKNPDKARATIRNATLKKKYGIGVDEYDALLREQGGVCAICKRGDILNRQYSLHVDHDHSTGRVRGILCQACNTTLGKMQESPELLRAAANYLETR